MADFSELYDRQVRIQSKMVDNGMYDEADLIGENLEKTIEFIAQNSHHAEEYVQAELVNSLLYILREDEESFDVVSAALRNAFNSTEYLKKHKKEMK